VERNKFSGIAMWRAQNEEGFFIAVFDLTGRALEFSWSGEPFKLPAPRMRDFIRAAEEFVNAGGSTQYGHFPPGSRLQRTPDGRFAVDVTQV